MGCCPGALRDVQVLCFVFVRVLALGPKSATDSGIDPAEKQHLSLRWASVKALRACASDMGVGIGDSRAIGLRFAVGNHAEVFGSVLCFQVLST